MEIKSRIIPAKPRNKELYFLKGTGGTVVSSSSGSNLGTTTPSYWKLIDTDEFDLPLENPYISTNYPIVTKGLPPEPIIDPENPEVPEEPISILNYLQIGDARLVYENNVLKALKENGDPLSFYATGEVSAFSLNGNSGTDDPNSETTLFSIANAVDAAIINPSIDDLLKYNGSKWVNVPMSSLITGGDYTLPTASATVLGGIKVGYRLSIASGVLSATIQSDNNFNTTYKTLLDNITTTKINNWTAAYNDIIISASLTTSALTLTQQDGGTVTASIPTWNQNTTGTAAKATILANTRKIWGQDFNGGSDVSGALSGATTINASTSVTVPKIDFGNNWTLEASGTELVFKYNGFVKQRFLPDGTILATAELTAYKIGI